MNRLPSIFLTRAQASDADTVRALVRAAYADWVPIFGREPLPMTTDYEVAVRDNEVDIATVGGQMVALIEMIVRADHIFIENIAVLPDFQGGGIGRQLIAHAEARALSLGLPELRLLTGRVMDKNVRLYQALGFQIDRTEPFMGGFTVYMSKTLVKA